MWNLQIQNNLRKCNEEACRNQSSGKNKENFKTKSLQYMSKEIQQRKHIQDAYANSSWTWRSKSKLNLTSRKVKLSEIYNEVQTQTIRNYYCHSFGICINWQGSNDQNMFWIVVLKIWSVFAKRLVQNKKIWPPLWVYKTIWGKPQTWVWVITTSMILKMQF